MNLKHFIKTLLIFTGMIFLGLLGVYLINYFDQDGAQVKMPGSLNVAK